MSDNVRIIYIDSISVARNDLRTPARLSALIEAEVRRTLEATAVHTSMGIANSEARVAGEVAQTVMRSLPGGTDAV